MRVQMTKHCSFSSSFKERRFSALSLVGMQLATWRRPTGCIHTRCGRRSLFCSHKRCRAGGQELFSAASQFFCAPYRRRFLFLPPTIHAWNVFSLLVCSLIAKDVLHQKSKDCSAFEIFFSFWCVNGEPRCAGSTKHVLLHWSIHGFCVGSAAQKTVYRNCGDVCVYL